MTSHGSPAPPQIIFRAEIGAESPLWDANGHMIWLSTLPITSGLVAGLEEWATKGWAEDSPEIREAGLELARRLRLELGLTVQVAWDND